MLTALCALTLGLAPQDTTPNCSTKLITSVSTFEPGKPFLMGFQIHLDKGWHCYWKNPGDSGEATELIPKVPSGWAVEPVVWPAPRKIVVGGITSYGYEGSPTFICRVTPSKKATTGTVGFDANWLICADMCVSAKDSLRKTLKAAKSSQFNGETGKFLTSVFQNGSPAPRNDWTVSARQSGKDIVLTVKGKGFPAKLDGAYFYCATPGVVDHGAAQKFGKAASGLSATLKGSAYAGKPPLKLTGVLVLPKLKPISINAPLKGDK